MNIPEFLLTSGKSIPLVGLGTAEYPLGSSVDMQDYILQAIEVGYRLLIRQLLTSRRSRSGKAIAEAIELGLVKSRDELSITTKLWATDAHGDLVLPALQTSLKNLGLEYVDLYLVLWPLSLKPGEHEIPFKKEDLLPFDYQSVWKAMEECQKLALARSIGVSNFSCEKLDNFLCIASIPPAVNQVEMNSLWQQKKLREYCKEKGIHITAYSTIGRERDGLGE